MKIPADTVKRDEFYAELTRQCLASRRDRFEIYQTLRNYTLFGSADAAGCPYNKIASTLETLCSMIYSPDSTRFSIHLGTTVPKDEVMKVPILSAEINDQWKQSGTHLRFGLGLFWSLAFGSMLFKTLWKRSALRTFLVEPHQFGVLREDIIDLEDQEAFCHCYSKTRTSLESDLRDNPRLPSILNQLTAAAGGSDEHFSPNMSRLILAGPVGGITGSVATGSGGGAIAGGIPGSGGTSYDYAPRVEAELVDMVDLYVWDDAEDDYQIVTMADPKIVIYDRGWREMGPRGVGPFTRLATENTLYDYFWGEAFVAKLVKLQEWRTEETYNIREIVKEQWDPPMSATGMGGIADEKFLAFKKAGGRISSAAPGGKIETHTPKLPENIFQVIHEIDESFGDQAGLMGIIQGKGAPGVRSKGQADLLARLGSARPKSRSIVVEEAAESLAGVMLLNIQENSVQRFTVENPSEIGFVGKWWRAVTGDNAPLTFIAEQFTKDYEVRVDGHSSSPVFVEDRKQDAANMLEARAIDRETFLDMVAPPGVQYLKEKLKLIEAKEAEQAKMQMQLEAKKGQG